MKAPLAAVIAALSGGILALILLLIGHVIPVDDYDEPYGDV